MSGINIKLTIKNETPKLSIRQKHKTITLAHVRIFNAIGIKVYKWNEWKLDFLYRKNRFQTAEQ